MNQIRMNGYVRISKQKAQKIFNTGRDIYITPCNCLPGNLYGLGYTTNINDWCYAEIKSPFTTLVEKYTWFNCNNETGKYPAFYIKEEQL